MTSDAEPGKGDDSQERFAAGAARFARARDESEGWDEAAREEHARASNLVLQALPALAHPGVILGPLRVDCPRGHRVVQVQLVADGDLVWVELAEGTRAPQGVAPALPLGVTTRSGGIADLRVVFRCPKCTWTGTWRQSKLVVRVADVLALGDRVMSLGDLADPRG